jgi:hypothetical protein
MTSVDPDRTALAEGIALFNRGEFYGAHEVLEHPWRLMAGDEREIYQGIIQVATGLHHATREKWRSAGTLIRRGIGRLEKHEDTWDYLPLGAFVAAARRSLEWLEARAADEDPGGPLPVPALPALSTPGPSR